jgi:IS5 family transposase
MQGKQANQFRLIQAINLEQLVPGNYILRHIDQAVDFSFVRERTEKLYTDGRGRYSIPPELVLRLFLLQYLFDLSDRGLLSEVAMHAGFRWFCRLNFDDPLPDRTTLVKLRRLWSKTGVFEDVMREIVRQCVAAGLVSGKAIGVDGTQVTANAATNSLAPIAPVLSLEEWLKRQESQDSEEASETPTKGSDDEGQGGSGPASDPIPQRSQRKAGDPNFRGERFSNETHRSKTDPDARLYRKGSAQEAKLRYLVHNAVDLRSGVILSTMATQANGTAERLAALTLLDHFLPLLPETTGKRYYVADAGYSAGWYLAEVFKRQVFPVVPMSDTTLEPIPTWKRRTNNLEQLRHRHQAVAEAKARNAVRQLQGPRTASRLQRARTRVEHIFAEAKVCHGLGRARSRGLFAVHTQALLTAIAQNVKRLAAYWRRKAAHTAPPPFALLFHAVTTALCRSNCRLLSPASGFCPA